VSRFNVIEVPPLDPSQLIQLEGALDKYWLDLPEIGRSLVKIDPRGAWVEKIIATLAERIGLPTAGCELGKRQDGAITIISPSFLGVGAIERAGEDLLEARLGRNYPYTIDAILSVVDAEEIALPRDWETSLPISRASDLVVGYFIFDNSWIGNIDRHSKNWGIQQTLDGKKELLPTYDHGLSLGVRMPEDKLPIDLADFSSDCRSSIQGEVGGALTMSALTQRLLELRPEAANYWIEQIESIDRASVEEILEKMPDGWMSDVRATFTIDLLVASCERLVMLASERMQSQTQFQASQKPKSLADLNEPEIEADTARPTEGLLYELANDPDATRLKIEPDDPDDLAQEDGLNL
jgi:hypothetical protein